MSKSLENIEPILADWEELVRMIQPNPNGAGVQLLDHAREMLVAVAHDSMIP
jgi:hypothetical protein